MKNRHPADSHPMFVIHGMFCREFAAIPDLVHAVPGGDRSQVAVVADHVSWMTVFLRIHQECEDRLRGELLGRVPADSVAAIDVTQVRCLGLAQPLERLIDTAALWRASSSVRDRDAVVAQTADLCGHLTARRDLDERCVRHLADARLVDRARTAIGDECYRAMSFRQIRVVVGMLRHEADPANAATMHTPWLWWPVFGRRAYRRHMTRVRGTRDTVRPPAVAGPVHAGNPIPPPEPRPGWTAVA